MIVEIGRYKTRDNRNFFEKDEKVSGPMVDVGSMWGRYSCCICTLEVFLVLKPEKKIPAVKCDIHTHMFANE